MNDRRKEQDFDVWQLATAIVLLTLLFLAGSINF